MKNRFNATIHCSTCVHGVRGKAGWECLASKAMTCHPVGQAKFYQPKEPHGGLSNSLSVQELDTLYVVHTALQGLLSVVDRASAPETIGKAREAHAELVTLLARYSA